MATKKPAPTVRDLATQKANQNWFGKISGGENHAARGTIALTATMRELDTAIGKGMTAVKAWRETMRGRLRGTTLTEALNGKYEAPETAKAAGG